MEGSRIILLGNPLRPEGPFYDAFSDPSWLPFHTDSRDVAKLDVPGLATDDWVEEIYCNECLANILTEEPEMVSNVEAI